LIDRITQVISKETLAILIAMSSHLSFPLGFVYINEHKFHPILSNLQRGLSIIISHAIICLIFGISLDFKSKDDLKYLLIRNSIIVVHQLIYSGMYFVVSYPVLNTINLIGPISVFFLDYFINGV